MNARHLLPCTFAAAGLVFLSCKKTPTKTPTNTPPRTKSSLPPGVSAFAGIDFSLPTDDLAPLGPLLANARVVGLGETAHRSGGILKAKNRIIKFAVSQLGFRVVGWETSWTDARNADRYIHSGCTANVSAIIRTSFNEVWHDTSLIDLLKWLCHFNRAHPKDTVHFLGFNNKQPWHDVKALTTYAQQHLKQSQRKKITQGLARCFGAHYGSRLAFEKAEVAHKSFIRQTLRHCFEFDNLAALKKLRGPPKVPRTAAHARCLSAIAEMIPRIKAKPPAQRTWLMLHARSLHAHEIRACSGPNPIGNNSRDKVMAEILFTEMNRFGSDNKAILSAHSMHLNRQSQKVKVLYPAPFAHKGVWRNLVRMGNWLHQKLGKKYVVWTIHASAHSHRKKWALPIRSKVQQGFSRLVENKLRALGHRWLLVNLRHPTQSFIRPNTKYQALYNWDVRNTLIVEQPLFHQFDGLVYLRKAQPWQGLPKSGAK